MAYREIRARKEIVQCAKCSTENIFLYLSDFSYGERLVFLGKNNYAYINMLEDLAYFDFVNAASQFLAKYDNGTKTNILWKAFGITCDPIDGHTINLSSRIKCSVCGSSLFENTLVKPAEFIEIRVPVVSHNVWNASSEDEKIKKIKEFFRV